MAEESAFWEHRECETLNILSLSNRQQWLTFTKQQECLGWLMLWMACWSPSRHHMIRKICMCAIKFSCHKHHDSVQLTTFITNCVNKKKDVISFMKNCSKDSHVITTYNRQNSFHAINRLKIQHSDILKHTNDQIVYGFNGYKELRWFWLFQLHWK